VKWSAPPELHADGTVATSPLCSSLSGSGHGVCRRRCRCGCLPLPNHDHHGCRGCCCGCTTSYATHRSADGLADGGCFTHINKAISDSFLHPMIIHPRGKSTRRVCWRAVLPAGWCNGDALFAVDDEDAPLPSSPGVSPLARHYSGRSSHHPERMGLLAKALAATRACVPPR
jgi:hypothetical protein